jgi:hypothetical protein
MKSNRLSPFTKSICLSGALLSGISVALAQDTGRIEKLEQENQDLRKRLEALESVAQKEGIMPSGDAAKPMPIKALSSTTLSGFVTTSYFYNSNKPHDREGDGYLWNTRHNSFSLNKFKLTLASPPAERSGDKWDAGYRVSMIWGEDSTLVDTGLGVAGFGNIREAFVELNVPIGTGLNVKAGQLISLLNWESGDGGAANPNFSQGYQWFFTGNGPSTGVQLNYALTDWLDVTARVQDGLYAGPVSQHNSKNYMGSIGLKPAKGLWVNLLGFGGNADPVSPSVKGGSMLAGYDVTSQFHTGFEFDYFDWERTGMSSAKLWSVGGWAWYDFTPQVGLALRAEYLDDEDGFGLKGVNFPGRPGSAITSPDPNGNVESVALTFNWRPVPRIKIQPEVRYDHTSYTGGFDGQKNRVVFGAGATYLF